MKFPTLVYKCPGAHARKGGTYDYTQVNNDAEMADKLVSGWFETLPEAIEGKPVEPVLEVIASTVDVPKRRGRPPKSTDLDVTTDEPHVEIPNELD